MAAAVTEIKESLKRRDAELARHGAAFGETDAKIDAISGKISDLTALKDRLEAVETRLNRPDAPPVSGRPGDGKAFVQVWQKVREGLRPERMTDNERGIWDAQTDAVKAYRDAFWLFQKTKNQSLLPAETMRILADPPAELKVMSAGDATSGGHLMVPPTMEAAILKPITLFAPIRTVVRVRSIAGPYLEQVVRTGQFSAQKVSESGTRSETTGLTYSVEKIPAHENYAEVVATWAMLEDSAYDIEAEIGEEAGLQFAVFDGTEMTTGNGVGGPEGFVTKLAAAAAYTALGHASTINSFDGLMDLEAAIKTGYAQNATWQMLRATTAFLRKAKGGDGQYLWSIAAQTATPWEFLGHRIVENPHMATVTTNSYPIAFGDWSYCYTAVDRIGIELIRDPFSSKASGAVEFLVRRRTGGQVLLTEAGRLGKVATT